MANLKKKDKSCAFIQEQSIYHLILYFLLA